MYRLSFGCEECSIRSDCLFKTNLNAHIFAQLTDYLYSFYQLKYFQYICNNLPLCPSPHCIHRLLWIVKWSEVQIQEHGRYNAVFPWRRLPTVDTYSGLRVLDSGPVQWLRLLLFAIIFEVPVFLQGSELRIIEFPVLLNILKVKICLLISNIYIWCTFTMFLRF